jgi:NAD(P)-dependent dehydrogenase (short-subunit alcohol dehydrogenase family)
VAERQLENRVAVVTAAGSGMGRAGAIRLAAEGAHVYVADLRGDAATETVKTITDAGGSATARELDVTDLPALKGLFEDIDSEHGVLHMLWNHAGTPGPAGMGADLEQWQINIDVNLKSAYYGTAYAEDLLEKAGGKGAVLFTSSVSGLVGSPFSPLYSMTKGGIALMTKAIAVAMAPKGIRANCVCPGPVETPMLASFLNRDDPDSVDQEKLDTFAETAVPLGRSAQPEEVAALAFFLLSDESSYITGVPVPIDGGLTAR